MSSESLNPGRKAVSLDELLALNDEIASLIRAGVPLELGLKEVGADHPGRLGELCRRLSDHMSRGMSLAEAVAAEGNRFPKVYGTVIEAGLRTGRLPAALESLSAITTELADLRRKIGFAMIYPLIVIALAYGLFVVFVLEAAERMRDTYEQLGVDVPFPLTILDRADATIGYWGWVLPAAFAGFAAWWLFAGRSHAINPMRLGGVLYWLPGVRRIAANYQAANFSELLALMVEHEVPLGEGVLLSAEVTADAPFIASARSMAAEISRGEPPAQLPALRRGIPPFLRWTLASKEEQGSLVSGLRMAAGMYRHRANDQATWMRLVFPIVSAVVIGGGATLVYTLALFLPMVHILRDLSENAAR